MRTPLCLQARPHPAPGPTNAPATPHHAPQAARRLPCFLACLSRSFARACFCTCIPPLALAPRTSDPVPNAPKLAVILLPRAPDHTPSSLRLLEPASAPNRIQRLAPVRLHASASPAPAPAPRAKALLYPCKTASAFFSRWCGVFADQYVTQTRAMTTIDSFCVILFVVFITLLALQRRAVSER